MKWEKWLVVCVTFFSLGVENMLFNMCDEENKKWGLRGCLKMPPTLFMGNYHQICKE